MKLYSGVMGMHVGGTVGVPFPPFFSLSGCPGTTASQAGRIKQSLEWVGSAGFWEFQGGESRPSQRLLVLQLF